MHWFQFPRIQELPSSTFTSFIWQCYSFSVHSVLFIILKIVLFVCLNKELSLRGIFSYLVLLIGGLENELSVTIFCRWQVNAYIHTNISKEWKISFCRLGRLNYCKYLNLFCTYTIWLFTAFAQINTSNIHQITCLGTLLGNGIFTFILDRKIKWLEAFQSWLMATSIGFSSLIGIIYLIIYGIVSFFWLYFYSSIQYGDN